MNPDPMSAARGVVFGFVLSAILWVVLGMVILWSVGCGGSPLAPTPPTPVHNAHCDKIVPAGTSSIGGEPRALLSGLCEP